MIDKTVILSSRAKDEIEFIEKSGIATFSDYINSSVSEKISDHADISFFFDGDSALFVAKESEKCIAKLRHCCDKIVVLPENLDENYPDDVKLNCLRVGNFFICNAKTVSPIILQHMIAKKCQIIDVKQGYTKCSVLPVSDNSIITDDISIYNSCTDVGIDVLFVSKGDVNLSGYDYGFIGGCGGKISNDLIIFCGNIRNHRDSEKILDFIGKYNVKYYCTDNKLTDIGSIMPLYKV